MSLASGMLRLTGKELFQGVMQNVNLTKTNITVVKILWGGEKKKKGRPAVFPQNRVVTGNYSLEKSLRTSERIGQPLQSQNLRAYSSKVT